jgi:hypothetical protein
MIVASVLRLFVLVTTFDASICSDASYSCIANRGVAGTKSIFWVGAPPGDQNCEKERLRRRSFDNRPIDMPCDCACQPSARKEYCTVH